MSTIDYHQIAATTRAIGDFYARYAAESDYLPRKTANTAEAAKYYGIAERQEAFAASMDASTKEESA